MAKSSVISFHLILFSLLTVTLQDQPWDFLVLAQFWPSTSCVFFEDSGCVIPSGVTGWTIHGLWPSRPGNTQPQFCNDTMKFNYSEIQSLQSELELKWPNYNKSGDMTDLWAHEWNKHGTCAYVLEPLQGELRYFTKAMALYDTLNIYKVLSSAGIVPSDSQRYLPDTIFNVVQEAYGNIPNIACYYDKETKTPYLDQVWLCYSKTFQMIDCADESTELLWSYSFQQSNFRIKNHSSPQLRSHFVDCRKGEEVVYKPFPEKLTEQIQAVEKSKFDSKRLVFRREN